MAIQPDISLNLRPQAPPPDPMENFGRMLALKGAIQQQQQNQQLMPLQLHQAQIQSQQADMEMQSQQGLMKAYQESNGVTDDAFVQRAAKYNVLPAHLMKLQEGVLKMATDRAKLSGDQLDNTAKKNDGLHALLDPVAKEANPQKQAAMWQDAQQRGLQQGLLTPQEVQQHPYPGSPDLVNQYIAGLNTDKYVTSQAVKLKSETDAAEAKAKMPGLEADSARKKAAADAMQAEIANPGQGEARIDAALPASLDPQANSSYKAAYKSAVATGDAEAAAHIVAAAASHAASISMANNPTVRAGKVAEAVAVERATGPLKTQQATSTAIATEIAKAKLSGDAFGNIYDPTARRQAEAMYDASSKDYLGKVSEARRLKDLITAAQQGNKAAPGVIPIEELKSFVNRVNAKELQQVGSGAGTAMDRIQGFIGKYTAGQPIPPDILRDTAALADLSEKAAERGYNYNLQIIRAKGANVKPIKPEDVFGGGTQTPATGNPNPNGYVKGHVYGNMTYLGGDPNAQASWK